MKILVHRKRLRPLLMGAIVSLLVATAACSGEAESGDPTSGPSGDPVSGGTATFIVSGEPPNLDPASLNIAGLTHGPVATALYGTLIRTDSTTGEVSMSQAESLTTTDGKQYTLTLREGLVFSDGTPFDASAVKFGWDRLKDPKVAAVATSFGAASAITESRVVDDRTLEFTLAKPTLHFAQDITSTALNFIAQPAALQAGAEAFTAAPVGAGPFTVESWRRQDRMTFVKNPRYFDAPRPYLDKLVVRFDDDQTRRLAALSTGDADIVMGNNRELTKEAGESGQGLVVNEAPTSGQVMVMFNMAKAPFDDRRAREALVLAWDMQAVSQVLFGDAGVVPDNLLAPESPYYSSDNPLPAPDPEKAQKLFDELAADGKPLSFTLQGNANPDGVRLVETLQAQLATFENVTVNVQSLDQIAYITSVNAKEFEATTFGNIVADPEPGIRRNLGTGEANNSMSISDPELDAALQRGRMSTDVEERTAAYRTVQERVVALLPWAPYGRPLSATISNARVGGIGFFGQGVPTVDTLWLAPESS